MPSLAEQSIMLSQLEGVPGVSRSAQRAAWNEARDNPDKWRWTMAEARRRRAVEP